MKRYDIAIIGTGPAGISAAITSKIRNKDIILIGNKELSNKITKAHKIENYLGLPAISGKDLANNFINHLNEIGIEIYDKYVGTVYSMNYYFVLQCGEEMIEATTVIVASGVIQNNTIKGEEEYLGKGVSYCATCDARLYKGKDVAVLGYSLDSVHEADFLAEIVNKVFYFPLNNTVPHESDKIIIVKEKPIEIIGESSISKLRTETEEYDISCVFILRDAILPDKLIPGIETDGAHIKIDVNMNTNIKGLFACGDIAGKPYQYIKAAGQGNIAALSAISYLNTKK